LPENGKTGLPWLIGAGIVGADIGTSVFYGTGILYPIVGYLAPIFILLCCLMMWLFKRTYEEGLAISPYNGGAYSMILRSMGRRAAVLAGALTFVSYLATAAVSALSGGFYLSSLFGDISNTSVVLLSFIPLILFGFLNTQGIKEPAKLVTFVAIIHFALLLIMVLWSTGYTIFYWDKIDFAKLSLIHPTKEITLPMVMYGFAAAFLGITGFESAAQIVEELEAPTMVTVRYLYRSVVILVSLTAPFISFYCLLLLSPDEVNQGINSLLSGLAEKLGGQIFLILIAIDATLTLFAATNTAFVGFIGLATTMAKQGNLPEVLLTRVAHKFPSVQGYPIIALSFMVISMMMSAFVAGEVGIVAKVYEIAFLGVMVSFCIGVVLMRNRPMRRDVRKDFLSKIILKVDRRTIPVGPLFSGIVLAFAAGTLIFHAHDATLLLLIILLTGTLFAMAYFRWGILERRLETRSDLRLGLGQFSNVEELPEDLPKFVLCTGGTGARRLIARTIKEILNKNGEPFELFIFHAEESKDPEGFFFQLLQRVVSQQITPIYAKQNIILTLKVLPGSFTEGLQTLKKMVNFQSLIFGTGRDPKISQELAQDISQELEVNVTTIIN